MFERRCRTNQLVDERALMGARDIPLICAAMSSPLSLLAVVSVGRSPGLGSGPRHLRRSTEDVYLYSLLGVVVGG